MSTPPDSVIAPSPPPETEYYDFETDPAPVVTQTGDRNEDYLRGTDGRDRLLGMGGDDTLEAKGGRDYLEGGRGDDILSGGGDSLKEDRFAFGRDDGDDIIIDYYPPCEVCADVFPGIVGDSIVLLGGSQQDITAAIEGVTRTSDGKAVLQYGETTIFLSGIDADRVTEEWFLLG